MEINGKTVLVCTCEESMPLDAKRLAKACGVKELELNNQLCRAQLGDYQRAILGEAPVLVACTQEMPLFEETRADGNPNAQVGYVNIREHAGWSDEAKTATPKIAALLAEAALDMPPTPTMGITSEGVILVYGKDERALDAARQLAPRMDVTLLLSEPADTLPPPLADVPIFKGTIAAAQGHFGAFEMVVDDYAPARPSARAALEFETAKDGALSKCEMILDLTGNPPLFPAHEKRDGYYRPDVGNPAEVQKILFELVDMVGEFDKPRYVKYDEELCAHARSGITGCTRCLDVCPASAIKPDGDHVAIDPMVCAGCGHCAAVCPTGAATYAVPPPDALLERLRTLLGTYRKAGGERPVLLIHDIGHGAELISLMARQGRGLPANVLPVAVNEVTQIGLDASAAALAYGAALVLVLSGPRGVEDGGAMAEQIALADAVMSALGYGAGRVAALDGADPEAVQKALYGLKVPAAPEAGEFLPMGGKRTLTMLALRHLHQHAPKPVDVLALPAGASFGAIQIDTKGCTLCLACVGACPTGALIDNPDQPQVSFHEDACVQCGLCRTTCPESVMTLVPRINFSEAARGAVLLFEDEPVACVRCGKPFATKGSVERVAKQLEGHSMYAEEGALDRVRMCEDCRVQAQFETKSPMAAAPRPLTRTTEDYIREQEEALLAERQVLREEAKTAAAKAGLADPAPKPAAKAKRKPKAKSNSTAARK